MCIYYVSFGTVSIMEFRSPRSLCIICMDNAREIRYQCGHLFACGDCAQNILDCAICRQPVYSQYNIRSSASVRNTRSLDEAGFGQADAKAGYISSGSGSFVDIVEKPCFECHQPGELLFSCTCLVEDWHATSLSVCSRCAASWSSCPNCNRLSTDTDFRELSNKISASSRCSSNWVRGLRAHCMDSIWCVLSFSDLFPN